MANIKADVITIAGVGFCLAGLSTVAAPVFIAGIPAIIGARIYGKHLENKEGRKKRKEAKTMLPTRTDALPLYNGYPWLNDRWIPQSKNPLTALAEESPGLARDVLINKILGDTHKSIASKPAEIFALQGRGIFAKTTRRKGIFSDSITTEIHPL